MEGGRAHSHFHLRAVVFICGQSHLFVGGCIHPWAVVLVGGQSCCWCSVVVGVHPCLWVVVIVGGCATGGVWWWVLMAGHGGVVMLWHCCPVQVWCCCCSQRQGWVINQMWTMNNDQFNNFVWLPHCLQQHGTTPWVLVCIWGIKRNDNRDGDTLTTYLIPLPLCQCPCHDCGIGTSLVCHPACTVILGLQMRLVVGEVMTMGGCSPFDSAHAMAWVLLCLVCFPVSGGERMVVVVIVEGKQMVTQVWPSCKQQTWWYGWQCLNITGKSYDLTPQTEQNAESFFQLRLKFHYVYSQLWYPRRSIIFFLIPLLYCEITAQHLVHAKRIR